MELTKQRKIVFGVLGLALVALVVDQVILPPPNDASAAAVSPHAVTATSSGPTVATAALMKQIESTSQTLDDAGTLAARLGALGTERHWSASTAVTAFVPSPQWKVVTTSARKTPDDTDIQAEHPDVTAFVNAHQLTGVMRTAQTTIALIDGKVTRPGQAVDGFVLKTVTPRAATFVSGKHTAVLKLQLPDDRR